MSKITDAMINKIINDSEPVKLLAYNSPEVQVFLRQLKLTNLLGKYFMSLLEKTHKYGLLFVYKLTSSDLHKKRPTKSELTKLTRLRRLKNPLSVIIPLKKKTDFGYNKKNLFI